MCDCPSTTFSLWVLSDIHLITQGLKVILARQLKKKKKKNYDMTKIFTILML